MLKRKNYGKTEKHMVNTWYNRQIVSKKEGDV